MKERTSSEEEMMSHGNSNFLGVENIMASWKKKEAL